MRTNSSRIFKALLLLALIAVLFAGTKSISNLPRTKFVDFLSPVLKSADHVSSALKKMVPFAALRKEKDALKENVEVLKRKLGESEALRSENDRLRALLELKKNMPFYTLPAQVIGRDPSNWSDSLVIDKGTVDGIRQNRAVLTPMGLAGRVVEAGKRSAKVLLITDPNSKVGVMIQRTSHSGILTGRSGGRCRMIYIAVDADVAVGDKVVTSGYGTIYPKNIPVGEVTRIGKERGRLYKYVVVKPSAELSKIEEVLCIR